MESKSTFNERINEILGDGTEDVATITLAKDPHGESVVVRVALDIGERGVVRAIESIPADKFTAHRLATAAESAYSTLTSAVAVFAAKTPGFDDA